MAKEKDAAEATSLIKLCVNVDHIHLAGKTDEVPERMINDLFVEQSIRECRNVVLVLTTPTTHMVGF